MVDNSEGAVCAVIGDLIGSREEPNQQQLLARLQDALSWTNGQVPAVQGLAATVGDEFQGVYTRPELALWASLLLSLKLRGSCEVRFGFGVGPISRADSEAGFARQSGAGWWRARSAIEEVEALQGGQGWPASLRARVHTGDERTDGRWNSFLICRDQVLHQMDERDARIALGLFQKERQTEIAKELELAQSSVSSRQRNRGAAALLRAHDALAERAEWGR